MATNQRAERSRRQPMRTCVGCRATRPSAAMLRVALDRDGTARVGRAVPGRGAWLCSAECLGAALQRKGLERAWRRPIPDGAIELLRIAFESTPENMRHLSTVGNASGSSAPTKG